MITLKTNCDDCIHSNICRFKDNAKSDMERLKGTMYGKGLNDDYDWDTILKSRNVNVVFSCPDFKKKDVPILR